jgi:hypothetical protein
MDAWNIADHVLFKSLQSILGSFTYFWPWQVDLFTNEQTIPIPITRAAYTAPTQAQWPGYAGVTLIPQNWGPVQVASRIATSVYPTLCSFPLTTTIPPLNIYGYVLADVAGNLIWAEQWADPVVMNQPYTLLIQARLNLGVLVVSDPSAMMDLLEDEDE